MNFISVVAQLLAESGFAALSWQQAVMLVVSCVLLLPHPASVHTPSTDAISTATILFFISSPLFCRFPAFLL